MKGHEKMFWSTSLSTSDFSTLYTTLPYILIKEKKLLHLIERAFKKFFKNEGTLHLACNDKKAFFTSTDHRGYKLWSCLNVYVTPYRIFWILFTSIW